MILRLMVCLFAFAAVAPASPTLDELTADPAKKKVLDKGSKILEDYFKAEAEYLKPNQKKQGAYKLKMDDARREFLEWLAGTEAAVGVDLRKEANVVIQMLDEARLKYLENRFKRGKIEYEKVADPRGMDRHEYAIQVGKNYDPAKGGRQPVVMTLHGRVINDRHPAFRSADFSERSRVPIYNYWMKSPAADDVLVVAPTSSPDGFTFSDESYFRDLQAVYRTLGVALVEYRGDWDKIFLEVEGQALRVCLDQALMFAGFIVRDRIDDRKKPFLDESEYFALSNLNGIPMIYVADEANWEKVGKPMSEALAKAYEAAGVPGNLQVIKGKRNVDGALEGGEAEIAKFVKTYSRPRVRPSFTWRFYTKWMDSPVPLRITRMNLNYDVNEAAAKAPLSEKAGKLTFDVRKEVRLKKVKKKNEAGEDVEETIEESFNHIIINCTEAEGLQLNLYAGLIDFDLPVQVTINGEVKATDLKFERDWDYFFDMILPLRFFMIPSLGATEFAFESLPEFVPPPPEKKEGEEKPAEDGAEKPAENAGAGAGTGGAEEKDAAHGK